MLTLYIQNVHTDKKTDIANYRYVVMVNAEKIVEGAVFLHQRADGWAKLVRRIADINIEEVPE